LFDVRQFVESLKRLYQNHAIDQDRIRILFAKRKINEDEMKYILEGN